LSAECVVAITRDLDTALNVSGLLHDDLLQMHLSKSFNCVQKRPLEVRVAITNWRLNTD